MLGRIEVPPRKLPAPLSGLTEVALDDLELAEASRLYEIDMGEWHNPPGNFNDEKCEICFAGGVIAFTLEGDINKVLVPASFDHATERKLRALDKVRVGAIGAALEGLGLSLPPGVPDEVYIPHYEDDPVVFKSTLREIATQLRENNR